MFWWHNSGTLETKPALCSFSVDSAHAHKNPSYFLTCQKNKKPHAALLAAKIFLCKHMKFFISQLDFFYIFQIPSDLECISYIKQLPDNISYILSGGSGSSIALL